MATPPFISGETHQLSPSTSLLVGAASWRGTSMVRKAFATLRAQTFQGRANGRFSLLDGRGPRVGAAKGVLDTEFRMGSGASTVVLIQSSYSSVSAPLITFGVNSSGQAVGSIQDINGTTVAAWAATSLRAVTQTVNIHMQLVWDSLVALDGTHHVYVIVNGAVMPHADFTTAPLAAWTPFQPLYITTGRYCETGFDGDMLFTQASAVAPVLTPSTLRNVDIEPVAISLPAPNISLSGAFAPVMTLTGNPTLPSLQLSGSLTPTVGNLTGTLTLPSLQLSGSLTVAASVITAWYRLASSTPVSGEWQTVVDVFGGSSMVQNAAVRKPAIGASANLLPLATYDGTDVLRMPLGSNNFNINKFGFALWVRAAGNSGQLFSIYNNDAAVRVLNLYLYPNGMMGLEIQFIDNATGRNYNTPTGAYTNGAYSFIRLQWDGSKTNEFDATGSDTDAKIRILVNETGKALTASNIGTGGAASVLRSPTGAAVWGGLADTDTPPNGFDNGSNQGPNTYLMTATPTVAQAANIMNFEVPTNVATFNGVTIAAVSGWLRLAVSNQSGGEWTPNIVDIMNPLSPMVQTGSVRRAAVGTSANSLPTMVFDGTDVHLWPQSPAHSATTKVGIWLRFKPASVTGLQRLYSVGAGIAGSSSNRLQLYTTGSALQCECYINGTDGRSFVTASSTIAIGTWAAIYLQYDSSRGGDANLQIWVNGVSLSLTPSNIGAGGTLTTLQAASGSAVFGAGTDSDTPVQAIANGGEIGPNIFALNDNLTAPQEATLRGFEAPT